MSNKKPYFGFIALTLIAESFLIYASILVKISEVSPIMLGFYRIVIALPIFALFNISKKGFCLPQKRDLIFMILSGVFFGLDLLFFNLALRNTSVANVNLICSLACFVLVPIGLIFFGEKLRLFFILGALIAIVGVFVLINGKNALSVANPFGDMLAFLSMVSYSGFLVLVYNLRRKYKTLQIMFFSGLGAGGFLLVTGSVIEGFSLPSDSKQWLIVTLIALFGQVLGQGFFGYIMGKISAQLSSLLLLFSPVIAALMGYVILGEYISTMEILGIFIILFGVFLAQR